MSKALVVDDSRALRMIVSRILREVGYQTEEAGNGRLALDLLNANPGKFDVALVDWNMPEMNGLELVKNIRSDPRHASLVIVMVTTETETEHMLAALSAGANEYVMKPFTRDILIEKLQMTGVRV